MNESTKKNPSDALEAAAVAFVRSPTTHTFSVLAQAARIMRGEYK